MQIFLLDEHFQHLSWSWNLFNTIFIHLKHQKNCTLTAASSPKTCCLRLIFSYTCPDTALDLVAICHQCGPRYLFAPHHLQGHLADPHSNAKVAGKCISYSFEISMAPKVGELPADLLGQLGAFFGPKDFFANGEKLMVGKLWTASKWSQWC